MLRRILLLAPLGMLGACVQRIAIQSEAAGVANIGLLTPSVPARPTAPILRSAGAMFGLIGGLADLAIQAERDRMLAAALAGADFDARVRWSREMRKALEATGYQVTDIPTPRPSADFIETYQAAPVDAFLDVVVFEFGMIAAWPTAPFRPSAKVGVRLAARDGRKLFQDLVFLNAQIAGGLTVNSIEGAAGFDMPSSSAFGTDPVRTAAAVEAGIQATAEAIAAMLRGAATKASLKPASAPA